VILAVLHGPVLAAAEAAARPGVKVEIRDYVAA
jgi:hypothetical protein